MAYTQYSQGWLEDPTSIFGILVEVTVYDVVAAAEKTLYLSNIGFITTDASVSYSPVIAGGVSFSEMLPTDGAPTMSFGDIELDNLNGELDTWLDSTKYIWVNRYIQVYIGDPFWQCTDLTDVHVKFEKIFDGVIADIDSKARDKINIKVRDKLNRLNVPLTSNKIGTYGTWAAGQSNQDTIKPLVFGEVFNITPILVDPSTLEFMLNDGNTEGLIELRDNGAPIYNSTITSGATLDLTNGKVKLTKALAGTLTASVQGVKKSINLTTGTLVSGTYSNNIANLIALITTQYGTLPLSTSELDLANLSAFASNMQPVGVLVNDTSTVISVCQDIVNSIGAQIFMTRKGLLQILRIGAPTSDAVVTITDRDILFQSLSISARTEVVPTKKIAYCKNWTMQTNLVTAIFPEHKEYFATDYITKSALDTAIQSTYKLSGDAVQKDTLLLTSSDANTEATRLNNFYKVPRTVYSFVGTSKLLSLKLGQQVTLVNSRFGLTSGVTGQVVSLSPNWLDATINVEVIV